MTVGNIKLRVEDHNRRFFFPPPRFERKDEKLNREARARAICAQCSVKEDCLSYALDIREPHGIWGGASEAERRQMLLVIDGQAV